MSIDLRLAAEIGDVLRILERTPTPAELAGWTVEGFYPHVARAAPPARLTWIVSLRRGAEWEMLSAGLTLERPAPARCMVSIDMPELSEPPQAHTSAVKAAWLDWLRLRILEVWPDAGLGVLERELAMIGGAGTARRRGLSPAEEALLRELWSNDDLSFEDMAEQGLVGPGLTAERIRRAGYDLGLPKRKGGRKPGRI